MELLRAEKLEKLYPNASEPAVDQVDLVVHGGEFLTIEGVSGSGKSTLLAILGGLMKPTGGKVISGDRSIYDISDTELAAWRGKKAGCIFQNAQIAKALTVRENLTFARSFGNDGEADVEQLIRKLGLWDYADRLSGQLSGGQRRRAMIGCVLIRETALILADEPTNDLDSEWAEKMIRCLRDTVTENSAVILVTHDERWVSEADVRYAMKEGRLERIR